MLCNQATPLHSLLELPIGQLSPGPLGIWLMLCPHTSGLLNGLRAPCFEKYLFHLSPLNDFCSTLKSQMSHPFVREFLCPMSSLQAGELATTKAPARLHARPIIVPTSGRC